MINIKHISKAKVLAALYNGSKVKGLGFLQAKSGQMTEEDAQEILDEYQEQGLDLYFDYLHGKVMKIDLTGDEFNPRLYDRDNGEGRAAEIIEHISAN